MTIDTFKQAARMMKCIVTENEDTVTLAFQNVTVIIPKDFRTGEAEAELFLAKGWMKPIRETLDNETK